MVLLNENSGSMVPVAFLLRIMQTASLSVSSFFFFWHYERKQHGVRWSKLLSNSSQIAKIITKNNNFSISTHFNSQVHVYSLSVHIKWIMCASFCIEHKFTVGITMEILTFRIFRANYEYFAIHVLRGNL